MSDDPERRRAVWPPPARPRQALRPPTQSAPIPVASLHIAERGFYGLLDKHLHQRWEDALTGQEHDKWRKIEACLDGTSEEFRAALMNKLIQQRISAARQKQATASQAGQKFKADLIERNIPAYAGQVKQLDDKLSQAFTALAELEKAMDAVVDARTQLDTSFTAAQAQGLQLQKVSEPWIGCWPGAEYGRGITDYDTPAGVERVKKEVETACARRHQKPLPPSAPKGGLFG